MRQGHNGTARRPPENCGAISKYAPNTSPPTSRAKSRQTEPTERFPEPPYQQIRAEPNPAKTSPQVRVQPYLKANMCSISPYAPNAAEFAHMDAMSDEITRRSGVICYTISVTTRCSYQGYIHSIPANDVETADGAHIPQTPIIMNVIASRPVSD